MKKNMQKVVIAVVMSLNLGCRYVLAMQQVRSSRFLASSLGGLGAVLLGQPIYKQHKSWAQSFRQYPSSRVSFRQWFFDKQLANALKNKNFAQAQLFLTLGADVNLSSYGHNYLLHQAISAHDTTTVKFLVRHKGIDLEKLYEGQTPLERAMRLENWECANILVDEGAKFTPKVRAIMHEKLSHMVDWA